MKRKNINKLLLINFITMATFNMAHPVTPKLINVLGLPAYMFGVFFSFMAVANFVMSPIWGAFSDQKGRKRFLIIGVIGYGISQLGFGLSTAVVPILLFRLLGGGLSVCFVTVAVAAMTDLTTTSNRIQFLSYHTASVSLGSAVGALLGGVVGQSDYRYTFVMQFVLCLVIAGIIALIFAESKQEITGKLKVYLGHLRPSTNQIDFKNALGAMIIVMGLISITTTAYNSTINYYVESVLNMPTTVNGLVMAVAGLVALIMNLVVNPYLGRRFDEYSTIKVVTLGAGTSLILASLMPSIGGAIVLLLVFIATSALIIPIHQSIVSKLAKDNYGEVMGIQGSAKAVGMIIGSLTAGFIFDIGNKLPFIFGGLCAILGGIVLLKLQRKNA
ncbi:MAG: MFS transporter [Cellulosilyticaceae bacterium]